MITILNRILPEDISRIIYDFAVKSHINNIMIGKLYLPELMMEKIIINFELNKCYNLWFVNDYRLIDTILSNIYNKYVVKNVYEFDSDFKELLSKYVNCLTHHNSYQKPFIQQYIDRIIKNLKIFL